VRRGVHVDEDTIRGESLRAVRRNGVAVVEVPHLRCIQRQSSVFLAVHPNAHAGAVNSLDGSQIPVLQVHIRLAHRELNPVSLRELADDFTVGCDAV
jgi:hypothetical protein